MPKHRNDSAPRAKPDPANARKYDDKQLSQIAANIARLGFLVPIIIDGDNKIAAGRQRPNCSTGHLESSCAQHARLDSDYLASIVGKATVAFADDRRTRFILLPICRTIRRSLYGRSAVLSVRPRTFLKASG